MTLFDQSWSTGRRASLVIAMGLLLWCALQAGWALRPPAAGASAWQQISSAVCGNHAFQLWQLGLPATWGAARGQAPGTALLWDVPLIAAYVWLLWHGVGRTCERRAGQALLLAVAADLVEDAATALVLWQQHGGNDLLRDLLHGLLAVATATKIIALTGCVILIGATLRPRR